MSNVNNKKFYHDTYFDKIVKLEEEFHKVKRMSQIDKFNQRYGKMIDK